jgi:hypothetical protein
MVGSASRTEATLTMEQNVLQWQYKFYGPDTRLVTFLLGGYIKDIDYFFVVSLSAEQQSSTVYYPVETIVEVFRPMLNWHNIEILIISILEFVLISLLLGIYIWNGVLIARKKENIKEYLTGSSFIWTSILIIGELVYFITFIIGGVQYGN